MLQLFLFLLLFILIRLNNYSICKITPFMIKISDWRPYRSRVILYGTYIRT